MRVTRYRFQQSGIALLQVLLLSMVISLLLIQLVYTARGQLELAATVEKRINADLIIHSALNEAIFARVVNGSPVPNGALNFIRESGTLVTEIGGFKVEASMSDVSGLLPLRYPNHPLWPMVLKELGMHPEEIVAFLDELSDMQDRDLETSRGVREPEFSRSGFQYPNAPIQTLNSLQAWHQLDSDRIEAIKTISHKYEQAAVNLLTAPSVIQKAALDGYQRKSLTQSAQTPESSAASRSSVTMTLSEYLQERFDGWVETGRSGIWRLQTEVVADDFSRSISYDFLLSPDSFPPFVILDQ